MIFTGSFIRFTWYLQAPLLDLYENLQAPLFDLPAPLFDLHENLQAPLFDLQAPLFDLHGIYRLLYLIYMKIYRLLYSIYMIFTGSFIRFT